MATSLKSVSEFHVSTSEDDDDAEVSYYETDRNWKNCMFLQFKTFWRMVICIGILTNIVVVLYYLVFTNESNYLVFLVVFYIVELFYFADICLAIMHRCMTSHRNTRLHRPRNLFLLAIDFISILPYYEVYCILLRTSIGPHYETGTDYTKLKVLLRLQYVAYLYVKMRHQPTGNQILAVVLGQMFLFIIFVMSMASLWYVLKDIDEKSWVVNLALYHFDENDPVGWLIICVSVIGSCFMHNWSGNIGSENIYEYCVLILTIMAGYLFHIMIFFGDLTAQYMRIFKLQISFSSRLNIIVGILNDWKINAPTIKRTIDHYNKFWEVRRSMTEIPRIFTVLPIALQKEVMLDMFWESLQHTHFFRDCDFNFKRSLALEMQPEIYLPGDYIVQKGRLKMKMYYVSAGVIQILGQNQQSPMISFSSGTVIGEICTFIPLISHVTVRCQTYCEIYTIDMRSLSRVLIKYKKTSSSLQKSLFARMENARKLQHPKLLKIRSRQGVTTMHWLKTNWDIILQNTKRNVRRDTLVYQQNPAHTSKYIDLYVLSDEVELKVNVICLTSQWPCILDENSSFRTFSLYMVLVAATLQCMIVPYVVFFVQNFSIEINGLLYMLDIFYIYGLYIELSTAFRNDQRVITDCKKIVLYKIKKMSMVIDIIATFPVELFAMMIHADSAIVPMLHLNRVLKVHRIFVAIQTAEKNLWLNPLRLKLIRYSLIILYSIYLIAGIMYGVTCSNGCAPHGWYTYNLELEETHRNITLPPDKKPSAFLSSLSYSVSVFMSYTDSLFLALIPSEMMVELIVNFIGYCVYSFCFSELAACAVVQMVPNTNYLEYLTRIRYFVNQYEIPPDYKRLIYTVTQCHWDYSQRFALTGMKGILSDAPENIKNSVLYGRLVECMNKATLFKYFGEDILWNIAPTIRLHVVPPGTVLCRELAYASHIQIILRGYAKVESTIPTDKYHGLTSVFKPFDVYPVLGITLGVRTFVRVTALTFVELAVIPYDIVMGQLRNNNMPVYKHYQLAIELHRNANHIILMRRKGRLPEMVSSMKSYGKGEYFVYETNEDFDDSPIDKNVMGPYLQLGKWKCIRYFFLPTSICPTKTFYVTWESIRCTVIGLNLFYIFCFHKYCEALQISVYIEFFFFSIFLVDTYIRMHCRYYNENGILIVHPLYTSKYYLTGSFIVDLYANFPFTILKLQNLFHGKIELYISHVVMLLTRPLGMYRIYSGISYIEKRSTEVKSLILNRLKHIIVALVVIGVMASTLEHSTCRFNTIDNYYCANYSWIGLSTFKSYMDYTSMIIISFYEIVSMFACTNAGTFVMRIRKELILTVIFSWTLVGVRLFVLIKIIALSIKGNVKLVEYQHNVKLMIKFLRDKLIDEEIIKEITDHYENLYTKTQGCDANEILSTFFPMMTRDVCNYMYCNILSSVQLFADADDADIRFFCHLCKEAHFKKDADIIRCNQVQDSIFIVHKGLVRISIAETNLKVLSTGGMFGCLHNKKTRQTITATALVHVELLVMNSTALCEVLQKHPRIKNNLRRLQAMNVEYMPSIVAHPKTTLKRHAEVKIEIKKRYMDKFMINSISTWFGWYEYLMTMHFAPIASIFTVYFIINHNLPMDMIWVLYSIDVIFLSKVVSAFFLTYIDHETGLSVKSFPSIIKRYFLRFDGFATDLITCLPLELLLSIFTTIVTKHRYYLINRSFRFLHMINYYNNCKNKLTVSKTLKWTFVMYTLLLLIHFISCIWFIIACPNRQCTTTKGRATNITNDDRSNLRIAYQYVVSTFTATGLRDQQPSTTTELMVTIAMIFIFQVLMIALQSEFATLLSVGKFVMNKYGEMVENLCIYMQSTHVSISIIEKVNTYLLNLWVRYSGHCIPVLVIEAPYYLKQDIMFRLYGHHLTNHVLFAKTHIDFIKQLVMHMKLEVYLPGQYIVQKGDVDDTMYFISQGEVKVLEKHGNNELVQCTLNVGSSFGEYQGFKKIAHVRSIQATVLCLIMCLNTTDWEYLLASFPASKETLFERIQQFVPNF